MMNEPKATLAADLDLIDQIRAEDVAKKATTEESLSGIQLALFKRLRSGAISLGVAEGATIDILIPSEERREEIFHLFSMIGDAAKIEDEDKRFAAINEVKCRTAYLLEVLTADPTLDAEYWLQTDRFAYDLPKRVLQTALTGEAPGLLGSDVEAFRSE